MRSPARSPARSLPICSRSWASSTSSSATSERRQYFNETDEACNKKVLVALENGLRPILCVGESLTEREQDVTMEVIRKQIKIALQGVAVEDIKKVVIAYEPIWAIGTGKTATAEQANEVCSAIRDLPAREVRRATLPAVSPSSTAAR